MGQGTQLPTHSTKIRTQVI